MGITGLLPQLKPIQNPVSLQRYEGQTLAIDGFAWLHKSACSCAYELGMDLPTNRYLQFFIKRIEMMKRYNVTPYFVFDGDSLPVKKATDLKRREQRVKNKEMAINLWNRGEKKNAYEYFQKAVSITHEMVKCIIDYCQKTKIQYVIAPFEADSQLVYLEKIGLVSGIISEDSDLLIFGCKRLITKLNDYGECIEICNEDFKKLSTKFPLGMLTQEQRILLVCLAGCDYTSGIPKVGLVTAMKFIKQFNDMDTIILNIKRQGKLKIPPTFQEEFSTALFAFQYQRVFCPLNQSLVHLNELPESIINEKDSELKLRLFTSIGNVIHKDTIEKQVIIDASFIHKELHCKIALGELHPRDFSKPLNNREIFLKLSSSSTSSSSSSSVTHSTKQIDNFFTKDRLKSTNLDIQRKIKNQMLSSKTQSLTVNDKLTATVKRRQLSNLDLNKNSRTNNIVDSKVKSKSFPASIQKSKYFKAKTINSSTPEDIEIKSRSTSQNNSNIEQQQPPSSSQDDVETEINESEIPTDISSSFIPPTQITLDSEPDLLLSKNITLRKEDTEIDEPSITSSDNNDSPTGSLGNRQIVKAVRSSSRTLRGSTNLLQQFRYNSFEDSPKKESTAKITTRSNVSIRKPLAELNSNATTHSEEVIKNKVKTTELKRTFSSEIDDSKPSKKMIVEARSFKRFNTTSKIENIGITTTTATVRKASRSISLLSEFIYRDNKG